MYHNMHKLYAGGYTVKTVSFSRSLLNPIAYHCNGRETSLQNCGYESNNECNRGVNITCVHRNTSGKIKLILKSACTGNN